MMILFVNLLLLGVHVFASFAAKPGAFCELDGRRYAAGESFSPSACKHCHCPRGGGDVSCFPLTCPAQETASCLEWESAKGSCCPVCVKRGCRVGNANYSVGEDVPTGDPCITCKCPAAAISHRLVCMAVMCAMPPCHDSRSKDGECCETCPNGPNCLIGSNIVAVGGNITVTDKNGCERSVCTCKMNGPYHTRVRCHHYHGRCDSAH